MRVVQKIEECCLNAWQNDAKYILKTKFDFDFGQKEIIYRNSIHEYYANDVKLYFEEI